MEELYLSHVLYKVENLQVAVKKMQDAGFAVEYGTAQKNAYNAIVWFEKGVFIELYEHGGISLFTRWVMKLFGYRPILDRMEKWQSYRNGWCEWSLETKSDNLNTQKKMMVQQNETFKFHKAKRKNRNGDLLRWELLMPNDIWFPFTMSAYDPNPRPSKIIHPNGVTC